tara:strand:+ start:283 stop:522 length:240 start_codon:yes stop_codon:yes gene_type:complete
MAEENISKKDFIKRMIMASPAYKAQQKKKKAAEPVSKPVSKDKEKIVRRKKEAPKQPTLLSRKNKSRRGGRGARSLLKG